MVDAEHRQEYEAMCDCPEVQKHPLRLRSSDGTRLWLPTLTEWPEMIHRFTCDFRILQDCYYWCALTRKQDLDRIKDMAFEMLWAQFYMWREHEQVWDRDNLRWVDERAYGVFVD